MFKENSMRISVFDNVIGAIYKTLQHLNATHTYNYHSELKL